MVESYHGILWIKILPLQMVLEYSGTMDKDLHNKLNELIRYYGWGRVPIFEASLHNFSSLFLPTCTAAADLAIRTSRT